MRNLEKRFDNIGFYLCLGLLIGCFVVGVFYVRERCKVSTDSVNAHIKTVMAIDRNCNECHLGDSFINLFKHKTIVGNDNIILKMMDNAKIKRW
jgi:hypothetical protein